MLSINAAYKRGNELASFCAGRTWNQGVNCFLNRSLKTVEVLGVRQARRWGVMASRCLTCLNVGVLCLGCILMAVASEEYCEFESKAPALSSALAFLEGHAVEADQDLLELAALPSISSMVEYHTYVLDAGKWLVKRLRRAGMKVSCSPMCSYQLPCKWTGPAVPSYVMQFLTLSSYAISCCSVLSS